MRQVAVVINKMDRVELRRKPLSRDRNGDRAPPCRLRPDRKRDHPDFGATWRRRRAAHRGDRLVHRPDRDRGARPIFAGASRSPICRCACRCRRSTSSTTGASSRAASRPGRSRSATKSRVAAGNDARACNRSRPGRRPTSRAHRRRRVPANRSGSRWTARFSSSVATSSPRSRRRPRRRTRCARASFGCNEAPLAVGAAVTVRVGMAECRGRIAAIVGAVDPG